MALTGLTEFSYKQFPENRRSLAGGMLFLGLACSLGSFVERLVGTGGGTGGREISIRGGSAWTTADR